MLGDEDEFKTVVNATRIANDITVCWCDDQFDLLLDCKLSTISLDEPTASKLQFALGVFLGVRKLHYTKARIETG